MEPRFFRCGHVRDVFNTKNAGKKNAQCRTCYRAYTRARYRRLRAEGATPGEIYGYRPLTNVDLAGILHRMGGG